MPDSATIHYYNENARQAAERLQAVGRRAEMYAPFLELLPPGGWILDAGCGPGIDSRAFLDLGYQVTALDGSIEMCRLASERLGQPALHQSFEEIDFPPTFHGVWAAASLLHVARVDLPGVLGRLRRALLPGSVLFASFRYGEGEKRRGDVLFNDFTEDSFRLMLSAIPGLEPLRVWKVPDYPPARPDFDWLHTLARGKE